MAISITGACPRGQSEIHPGDQAWGPDWVRDVAGHALQGRKPDTLEVIWGLKPGQEVVTTGAFLLKTKIMKGSIGAGCCD